MGGSSGSSGSGDSQNTMRYAPYLEDLHQDILNHSGSDTVDSSFIDILNATLGASPYGAYTSVPIDSGFFGGSYTIASFPSLWDMFGKFMAGLDLHELWAQVYTDVVSGPEVANSVSAHSAILDEEIDTTVMPKFIAGMRDINSVISSAFVTGKAIIQASKVKAVNDFAAKLELHLLSIASEQWGKHLSWNETVIRSYADIYQHYYGVRFESDKIAMEYESKDAMWDINLFDAARAVIGAMSGATASTAGAANEPKQISQTQKTVSGAMAGAAAGSMVYPGWGTLIGGVVGAAASFL